MKKINIIGTQIKIIKPKMNLCQTAANNTMYIIMNIIMNIMNSISPMCSYICLMCSIMVSKPGSGVGGVPSWKKF